MLHAGTLVGEDANQALQADINADPTTRLEAATLYRDASGWLTRVHSSLTADSARGAQGPEAEGQGPAGEQPHDMILEVEDAGLEGGQEGVAKGSQVWVAEEPAAVKQERDGGEAQQAASGSAKAEPVHVKEEEAEGSGQQGSGDKPSIAIFGEEIAAGSGVKHEDESANPHLRQDQAGSATHVDRASSSAQDPQNPDQITQDSKQSLPQQDKSEPLESNGLAQHSISEPTPANQPLPAVKTFTVLCRENGMLQIFALPDMQLLFSYSNPIEGPPLLTQGGSSPRQPEEEEARVRAVEARMESFGPRDTSGDIPVSHYTYFVLWRPRWITMQLQKTSLRKWLPADSTIAGWSGAQCCL